MISAIVFDMDGVLIDSEAYTAQAAISYFSTIGMKTEPDDFIPFVGAGEDRYLGGVAEKYGVKIDLEEAKAGTYAIYEKLVTGNIQALPGVVQFLTRAHKAGIRMAVATSADKRKMEINLAVMGLNPEWFTALIHGKNVARKKPFPDIYLKALESLGVESQECVVFEDAPNGIQAAKSAQMLCGGITSSFSEEKLREEGADFIISGFDDFDDFSTIEAFNRQLLRFKARELATQARMHAYAPYSHFSVGAAVVSGETAQVYSGCNVENSSYGGTICAERGAILGAVSQEGDFPIDMVVVVSDDDPPAPPCALCLQVIAEFATEHTMVYLYDTQGRCEQYRFNELLPHPFIFPTRRPKSTKES
jgi:cytidine deaminase